MDTLKILYGQTRDLPEVDYEENLEREIDAIQRYPTYSLLYSIGTKDFEEMYKTFVNDVKYQDMSKLRDFCTNVFDKLWEIYEYELPQNLNLDDRDDIYKLFDFLAFIEFNNIGFLVSIWEELMTNIEELKNIDIEQFCYKHKDLIYTKIENNIKKFTYDEIITEFLRTYSKLLEWFVNRTITNKFEIIFTILTRRNE